MSNKNHLPDSSYGNSDFSSRHSPFSQPFPKPLARLTLQRPVHDCLETRLTGDLMTLYLDGISIVSYSPHSRDHIGRMLPLQEADLTGYLFLNTDFFTSPSVRQKPLKSTSQMRNLAKTFFTVNSQYHVALIQYLLAGGMSSEHYHSLDESIVQLAGQSTVTVRPVADDTQHTLYELHPGEILRIPPQTLHRVRTSNVGSITVPIKQTLVTKSDTHYPIYSQARMDQELRSLLDAPCTSGNETVNACTAYCQRLGVNQRTAAEDHLQRILNEERYTNLKFAFNKLLRP
ncbi:MAG: cupin domain-containing protein [Candidatus Woesearchaeota archaeon]|nr:cupin domain-containing protein [Candidatus Woesearchaeota archaeon]